MFGLEISDRTMWPFLVFHVTYNSLTLLLPQAIIIEFCQQRRSSWEGSHRVLRCLTSCLSTLHLNFFPVDSLLKNKAGDKYSLEFGAERVKRKTRAGVCKTLCPQLPDSNTAWLQHCLPMMVIAVQIYKISMLFCQKGNNPKMGDNSYKKINTGPLFSSWGLWNFKTLA